METGNLVRNSDLIAVFGGIAFAFGSIACMMVSVHLARARDFGGMTAILRLAGGFTFASCCLLAATTYCVVHRCEEYCQTLVRILPAVPSVQADQISTGTVRLPDLSIHTASGHHVDWRRPTTRSIEATFL